MVIARGSLYKEKGGMVDDKRIRNGMTTDRGQGGCLVPKGQQRRAKVAEEDVRHWLVELERHGTVAQYLQQQLYLRIG